MLGSSLDTLLDRTVLLGYSSVGYRWRRRRWSGTDLPRLDGRVVLVTGASSGLGLAAATGFASLGATVRLLARDGRRGEEARAQVVARTGRDDVQLDICDLADLGSVRRYAARLTEQGTPLHVLVNNAGVLSRERTLSADGIELMLATNVIGPFLLTGLLVPLLADGDPGRIINVSSGGMYAQRVHIEDLQMADEQFKGAAAYARCKRAQVMLTEEWTLRLSASGVVAHAMHPGWVDTPGLAASLPRFHRIMKLLLRTPEQGADTIVWLGCAREPARSSGGFWHDRRRRPTHLLPWTRQSQQERRRLWLECERLSDCDWQQT